MKVPFIIGVLTLSEKEKEELTHCIIIDIDNEKIYLPKDPKDYQITIKLPGKKRL